MKTYQKSLVGIAAAAAALAAYYGACAGLRTTEEDVRRDFLSCYRTVTEAAAKAPDTVLPMLERARTEHVWRARFPGDWKAVSGRMPRLSRELKVSAGNLAGIVEDVFIKFSGGGFPDAAAQERIRKVIAFAEDLEPSLSASDAKSLRERLLDAHFVVNDFDGAVAILEKGLAGHSENWCRAAIAKIRAHQAEERKDDAEALRQFVAFGEAMSAEPDSGSPDFDPSTGVAYCRAWVLAKNARRCSEYSKKLGRGEDSAAFLSKARELYAKAVEDTADDAKSLAVLKKEMAEAGL